jgi:hypothetical protein
MVIVGLKVCVGEFVNVTVTVDEAVKVMVTVIVFDGVLE